MAGAGGRHELLVNELLDHLLKRTQLTRREGTEGKAAVAYGDSVGKEGSSFTSVQTPVTPPTHQDAHRPTSHPHPPREAPVARSTRLRAACAEVKALPAQPLM